MLHRKAAGLATILCVAAAAFAAAPVRLPEGEARRAVETACASCHGLDVIVKKRLSNPEWRDIVNAMMNRGAAITKDQEPAVIAYLARNFGPPDRGRELVEDICTYCHNLNKLQGHALNREEWSDLIKGMIFEGAPVTDEEFSLILDYLTKNFGEKDPETR